MPSRCEAGKDGTRNASLRLTEAPLSAVRARRVRGLPLTSVGLENCVAAWR